MATEREIREATSGMSLSEKRAFFGALGLTSREAEQAARHFSSPKIVRDEDTAFRPSRKGPIGDLGQAFGELARDAKNLFK